MVGRGLLMLLGILLVVAIVTIFFHRLTSWLKQSKRWRFSTSVMRVVKLMMMSIKGAKASC